jgi:hypothetical protein
MVAITYSMKKEIKVAKWGTPKKIFKKNYNILKLNVSSNLKAFKIFVFTETSHSFLANNSLQSNVTKVPSEKISD